MPRAISVAMCHTIIQHNGGSHVDYEPTDIIGSNNAMVQRDKSCGAISNDVVDQLELNKE